MKKNDLLMLQIIPHHFNIRYLSSTQGRDDRPFDGDVWVLEAVYDGTAVSLDCIVVGVNDPQ